MAKKTAAAAPKTAASEKKTVLILLVIVLFLTNIVFGVMLYDSSSRATQALADTETAKKNEKQVKDSRDEERARLLGARIRMGVATAEEQTQYAALTNDEPIKKAALKEQGSWADMNSKLEQLYKDEANPKEKAASAVVGEAVSLAIKKADDAAKVADEKTKNLDDAQKAFEAELTREKARTKQAQDAQAKAIAEKAVAESAKNEAAEKANAEIKRKSDEIADLTRKLAEQGDVAKKERDGLLAKVKELELVKEKLDAKLATLNTAVAESPPRGKIESADKKSGSISVDKGSADGFQVGTTFSVYAAGTSPKAAASGKRKGALEIVQIAGPHQSFAKLTDETDAIRDPIIRGDLIFNPAFRPGIKNHVAIAGIVDLNGDGRDDTAEFVRLLERQGVVVDGWLDLKDLSMKGAGPSYQTDFLILGDMPTIGDRANANAGKQIEEISKVQIKAKESGVEVTPVRKFMDRMGMQVTPSSTGSGGGSNPFGRSSGK